MSRHRLQEGRHRATVEPSNLRWRLAAAAVVFCSALTVVVSNIDNPQVATAVAVSVPAVTLATPVTPKAPEPTIAATTKTVKTPTTSSKPAAKVVKLQPGPAAVAEFVTQEFEITKVVGVTDHPADGDTDHPKGLALDLYGNPATTEQLHRCVRSHQSDWDVKRVWRESNHVHVDFRNDAAPHELTCD